MLGRRDSLPVTLLPVLSPYLLCPQWPCRDGHASPAYPSHSRKAWEKGSLLRYRLTPSVQGWERLCSSTSSLSIRAEELQMHEKYSIKVTLLVQEKQNLIQRSKEMEEEEGEEEEKEKGPTRKANAESRSSIRNPKTEAAHHRHLPYLRPGSLRALATSHSLGACQGPRALTHTLRPAESCP